MVRGNPGPRRGPRRDRAASEVEKDALSPRPTLSVVDTVALIVGVVIGVGIFRTPSLVAANAGGAGGFIAAWLLGGLVSLLGALCYAELATAYPHVGGDYHYLSRAFGREIAFLFGWARMVVIQTGSIASVAFVFGDYFSQLLPIGGLPPAVWAALAVAVLTTLNVVGVRQGKWTQNVLTGIKVLGLSLVVVIGIAFAAPAAQPAAISPSRSAFGLAMVFVLYTYGGWNEAAYISAELQEVRRNMTRALVFSIGLIAAIYVLINIAYLRGLGLPALSGSQVVAADLLRQVAGSKGALFVSCLAALSALGVASATIFTGARTNCALGRSTPLFGFLGAWRERAGTPANALFAQGIIALLLVLLGALTRHGFETMVGYTAPVFWFFFLLAGLSLFVLRTREPDVHRAFRVPLYPLTPMLFCAMCVYMLQSSLAYAGVGALVGVGVLLAGVPVLLLSNVTERRLHTP